jgi:putative Mg2+ transporter-C (MgtC) family protein
MIPSDYSEIFLRLGLAIVAGGFIGLEREVIHKPAGIRTHMLVCLGSALFAIITVASTNTVEVGRIIAGVATGVGFLGAGTIFKAKSEVHGLTTAASIWVVAAVGVAVGLGYLAMTAIAVALILLILNMNRIDFFRGL